jgi:uncharacterized protein YdaU (DUF1376 family)
MKFYKRDPDRALAGMAELSFEERGAYNSLLDLLYSRDGDVPDDDERVARMLSCNKREWVRLKRALIGLGKVWVDEGKLCAKRVQETINEAAEFSSKQRSNVTRRWSRGDEKSAKSEALVARKTRESGEVSDLPANSRATQLTKTSEREDLSRASKSEKSNENNSTLIPRGITKPQSSGNTSTPTPTPTPTTPPYGGEEDGRPPRESFAPWEQSLFAVDGVKGSGLELCAMGPIIALQRDGFSLTSEVIPVVKADIASARDRNRLNRLTWATIAKKVRESRLEPASARPGPTAIATNGNGIDWPTYLTAARRLKAWDFDKLGALPHTPGCRVPMDLLAPDDGKGWTAWRAE